MILCCLKIKINKGCLNGEGKINLEKQKLIFKSSENQFLFMTPQTLRNDLQKEFYSLNNTALIIFDEAHRAAELISPLIYIG